MSVLRYVHRLFLCLVVGVTAFGVSGYLLRPKPNWTVLFAEDEAGFELIDADHGWGDSDDVWIRRRRKDDMVEVAVQSARNGVVVETVCFPCVRTNNDAFGTKSHQLLSSVGSARLVEGLGLVVCGAHRPGNNSSVGMDFHVLDPSTRRSVRTVSLDGYWEWTDGGRKAWRLQTTPDGGRVLRVADLATGVVVDALRFGSDYSTFDSLTFAVSPDAALVAVAAKCRRAAPRREDVEVWDAARAKQVHTLTMPAPASPDDGERPIELSSVRFERGAKKLYLSGIARTSTGFTSYGRTFDLDAGRFEEYWTPGDDTQEYVEYVAAGGDIDLWIWPHEHPKSSQYVLYHGRTCAVPWRELPLGLTTDSYASSPRQREILKMTLAPTLSTLIVQAKEAPWTEGLPQAIARQVPEESSLNDPVERTYWHDWRANRWLDVGCGNVNDVQVRSRFLVTSRRNSEGALLQSWPLPPRDPKWPAAGIAVGCAAAVWWWCARRARRRVRGNVI